MQGLQNSKSIQQRVLLEGSMQQTAVVRRHQVQHPIFAQIHTETSSLEPGGLQLQVAMRERAESGLLL